MTELEAKRTEEVRQNPAARERVLQNRNMADYYADPDNLDEAVGRCVAARPRLSALKNPRSAITDRDKAALSDKIHSRLMIESEAQHGDFTAASAERVVQQEIERLLDAFEQDLPDKPVRTVASEGYSGNPDAQMQSVKTGFGWTAGPEQVSAAFRSTGQEVPETFERAMGEYNSLLNHTTLSQEGPLAALNFPPDSIRNAQGKLDELITIVENAIDDYEAFQADDELVSVTNSKLEGLRLLQQTLTAEKRILESVSRAVLELPSATLRELTAGPGGAAHTVGVGADSLKDLMQDRRFSAEAQALEQKVDDYTRMLRNAPLVEDGHLSYNASVSLNLALD